MQYILRRARFSTFTAPSSRVHHLTKLSTEDYMPMEAYRAVRRPSVLRMLSDLRNSRRVLIGPHASFCFENYDSLWIQAHEMVHIEKGDVKQFTEESVAYSPLLPTASSISGCLFFEIENPKVRAIKLREYGHVEETVHWDFGNGKRVRATSLEEERTTPDGKTSAVHFLQFQFDESDMELLKASVRQSLSIDHSAYQHSTVLGDQLVKAILHDMQVARDGPKNGKTF